MQRAVRDETPPENLSATIDAAAKGLLQTWPEVEREISVGQTMRANADALYQHNRDYPWNRNVNAVLHRAGRSIGEAGDVAAADHFERLAAEASHLLARWTRPASGWTDTAASASKTPSTCGVSSGRVPKNDVSSSRPANATITRPASTPSTAGRVHPVPRYGTRGWADRRCPATVTSAAVRTEKAFTTSVSTRARRLPRPEPQPTL